MKAKRSLVKKNKKEIERKEIMEKLMMGTQAFEEEVFNKNRRRALRILRRIGNKLRVELT